MYAFWLGLYQDLNDPEYQEPGDEAQNYAGWKWVNGQKLRRYRLYKLVARLNQMMLEAHEHSWLSLSLATNGIKWNDMSVGRQMDNPGHYLNILDQQILFGVIMIKMVTKLNLLNSLELEVLMLAQLKQQHTM